MRRILIGVAVATVAVAAAVLWGRPGPQSEWQARLDEVRRASDWREPLEITVFVDGRTLEVLTQPHDIDPGISFLNCGIVREESTGGGHFMLVEECVSRNGRVERRRFPGVRVEDGTSYGWMIRPDDDA